MNWESRTVPGVGTAKNCVPPESPLHLRDPYTSPAYVGYLTATWLGRLTGTLAEMVGRVLTVGEKAALANAVRRHRDVSGLRSLPSFADLADDLANSQNQSTGERLGMLETAIRRLDSSGAGL